MGIFIAGFATALVSITIIYDSYFYVKHQYVHFIERHVLGEITTLIAFLALSILRFVPSAIQSVQEFVTIMIIFGIGVLLSILDVVICVLGTRQYRISQGEIDREKLKRKQVLKRRILMGIVLFVIFVEVLYHFEMMFK